MLFVKNSDEYTRCVFFLYNVFDFFFLINVLLIQKYTYRNICILLNKCFWKVDQVYTHRKSWRQYNYYFQLSIFVGFFLFFWFNWSNLSLIAVYVSACSKIGSQSSHSPIHAHIQELLWFQVVTRTPPWQLNNSSRSIISIIGRLCGSFIVQYRDSSACPC